ncbi:hypothetical protein NHX12_016191, partial [Muraenolepis orangiensis]
MSELQLKEVREVVRKARASSAPGPSGTSYKVYKYCPKLLLRLWYILRVFWRRGRIPDQWRVAEGVWIPKEENSTQLDQFRIISLLCVEAKVFFSAVSKRLCTYLAENTYIDTSVQEGGISGMPGCLEHTGVVTQLIREARENKGNLSVLWLDLENAFGSIPHKLVQFTLTKHHVPSRCRDLIADYYSNFRMRVSSGAITSSWHKVEIGIIRGCTISVTLFSLAMNMLTKSAEPECRGPRTNSGQRQPPIRTFMDDLTVMTESVPGCRWILKGLEELVEWARMRFKPAKSRSMVLRKGKVVDKFRFNIADTAIPSISEKPVKSLGKVVDCSLRDTTSIQSTCTELDGWLKSVDKSGLPGKFKAWVYQHGILPRILWPLLVYAVPISTVETLERRKFRRVFEGIAKVGQSTDLNDFYTELFITERVSGEVNKEHEVRLIETASRKPAKEETPIKLEDIFKPLPGQDQPSRTIMTTGVAGIGKTVLTHKFTLDWAEGKANHDIHFTLPFTFRELNLLKEKEFSLMELLHHFFIQTKGILRYDLFQVVFILDGLDECRLPLDFQNNPIWTDVTKSTSVDVLLTNLIRGDLLPSARIWITTRPAAANQIPAECVGMVTEVRGFTDPQKEEYFRKRFREETLASTIISHIKTSRSLHIMCHIP